MDALITNHKLNDLIYEKQALAQKTRDKDAAINTIVKSSHEVEDNLHQVELKQNIISKNSADPELKTNSKARINASITAINLLKEENHKKLAQLTQQLKNSKVKVARFDKMIENLNKQLAMKNTELEQPNQQLLTLNTTVAKLNTNVDVL